MKTMMLPRVITPRTLLVGTALCVLFGTVFDKPASAGFEFVPAPQSTPMRAAAPSNVGMGEYAPAPQAAPVVPVEVGDVLPPIGAPMVPPMGEPKMRLNHTAPVAHSHGGHHDIVPPASAPVPAPVSFNASVPDAVQGFGRDLPLVLAMRQIVPTGYGYIFDPSVDQGVRVNWDGGAAWPVVLERVAAQTGLIVRVTEQSKTVWVGPAHNAPVVATITDPVVMSAPTPVASSAGVPAPISSTISVPVAAPAFSSVVVTVPQSEFAATRVRLSPTGEASAPAVRERYIRRGEVHSYGQASAAPTSITPAVTAHRVEVDSAPHLSDTGPVQHWKAVKGDSVRNVLDTWSEDAGGEMIWRADRDYVLPYSINVQGDYASAVLRVLDAMRDEPSRPWGTLHPNLPYGPSVLVVENGRTAPEPVRNSRTASGR